MTDRFDYFVMFAGMRTGSNFLEENLNAFDGINSYGEVFNPNFIGGRGTTELMGISLDERDRDPFDLLLRLVENTKGLAGFRFFHDHDHRMLDYLLAQPRCAKIILTRNPLESYVSRKIAVATGQWRLGDMKNVATAKATFDEAEFKKHLNEVETFNSRLKRTLQVSGQTAFWLDYEDTQSADVLNGLVAFLGVTGRTKKPDLTTKKQNPGSLRENVENPEEMDAALRRLDMFDSGRVPVFEPRRGPAVPGYVAAARSGILYQPVRGGPERQVLGWLADLDGVEAGDLQTGFVQKTLRQWKDRFPQHRSFSVVRHPVARLHESFLRYVLKPEHDGYSDIREILRKRYDIPTPGAAGDTELTSDEYRKALLAFAGFVAGNLSGQTNVRVDPAWATQSAILEGMAEFGVPHLVLHESELARGLDRLAEDLGLPRTPLPEPDPHPYPLAGIYDAELEKAVRRAYRRDYTMLGFSDWG